ncbi:MAG: hypothetical protein CO061_00555 [Candidatus Yonathbacteria bacterium CG_4_9_14_0_2_um_filter_47_74]|nr:MAG: hypothetical protein COX54_00555 [Candidatus Yonathbacteria bacterium CG23_combo_of_CG06-09_8_20_14_all_46_18]PJC21117.1 MAG: hypothetical protein CO061_00555 [Candidatus Yonathbacteria bacterium CG_4_9_14_0_2_um_filter_47_74]
MDCPAHPAQGRLFCGHETRTEREMNNWRDGGAKSVEVIEVSGFNPLGAALLAAMTKKAAVAKVPPLQGSKPLPVIGEESMLSSEEIAAEAAEVHKRREWAEGAGAFLEKAQARLAAIYGIADWSLSRKLGEEVGAILSKMDEIAQAGDENLRRHVEYARLLSAVRAITSDEAGVARFAREIVPTLLASGRYTIASRDDVQRYKSGHRGALPSGAFWLSRKTYFPYQPKEGEEKSAAQYALETEVRKALRRLPLGKRSDRDLSARTDLNREGNDFLSRVEGLYGFDVPPRNLRGKSIQGGFLVVSVAPVRNGDDFKVIRPVDGSGACSYAREEAGKWYLTSLSPQRVRENKKLPPQALLLARHLNMALAPVYSERKRLEALAAECGECEE